MIVYFVLDSVVAEISNGEVWSHYSKSLFIDEDDVPSWITSDAVYTLNFRNSSWWWCWNPELSMKQFKHNSWNLLFWWMVSHPESLLYCWWMVSHPGQILIVHGWCPILVTAPELQEDGVVQCYIFDLAWKVLVQPKLLEHCMLTIRGVSIIYHTLY